MPVKRFFSIFAALLMAAAAFAGFKVSDSKEQPAMFRMAANGQFKPGDTVNFQIVNNTEDENFTFTVYRVSKEYEFISEYLASRTYGRFDIWTKDGTYLQFMEKVREFTKIVTPSGSYYYDAGSISAGVFDKAGIYIIKAFNSGKVAYLPIYVSSKMMIVKKGEKNLLTFTANSVDGTILKPESTTVYYGGSKIATVTPGSDGLSLIDLKGVTPKENATSLITSVVDGELVYSDPYIFFGDGEGKRYFSTIYTNQPVYRPGATINYKGIIRFREDGEMGVPSKEKVSVKITDPSGTEVLKEDLVLDDFGSFYSSFKTNASLKPGTYYINAQYGDNYFYSSFSIEEYKKPEFRVSVVTEKTSFFNGEKVNGNVKADYYYGQPVSGANVKIRVMRKPYRVPWWIGSDYAWYYKAWYPFDYGNYEYLKEITGTLNSDGSFAFSFNTINDSSSSYTYSFEANVTDQSLREIKGTSSVTSSVTDFLVTAGSNRYFVKPGAEVVITANSYNFDLTPIAKELTVIINKTTYINDKALTETVYKTEVKTNEKGLSFLNYTPTSEGYYSVMVTGRGSNGLATLDETSFYCFSGNGWYWNGDRQEAKIVTDKEAYLAGDTVKAMVFLAGKPQAGVITIEQNSIIKAAAVKIVNGTAEYTFIAEKNFYPSFNITFSGAYNSSFIFATQKVGVINEEAKLNVKINPAKPKYKPGEEAEYLVKVTDNTGRPVKNAQLSFGSVDESIYAIKADNTPSMYESFYKDEFYYTQTTNSLEGKYGQSMSRPASLLDTKYSPEDPADSKSGTASLEIKLKTMTGENFADSKFEILITNGSLIKRATFDGINFTRFTNLPDGEYDVCISYYHIVYPLKKVVVSKGKTTSEEIFLDPYKEDMEFYFSGSFGGGMVNKSLSADGAAIEEKSSPSPPRLEEEKTVTVRENFVDAPYWNPAVLTDGSGEAEISFKLPDNLTSWRSTVKVITKNTFTGDAINNVFAAKDLLIRLETPRFFKEGDTTTIIANIHNYHPSEAKTRFKFNFTNLNPLSFDVKSVVASKKTANSFEALIPSKGLATVEIKTVIPFVNYNSEIYFEAISDQESDAIRITVPVVPIGIKAVNYLNSILQNNENEKTLEFTIPQGVNLKTVNLSLALSPTLATSILHSLDGLVDYPYGCVEQTMSRFLPALITAGTLKQLNVPVSSFTLEKLPDVIDKGLARLYDFQNPQGGWGWWKNDPVNPYMTAYVMYGFNMAQKLGYKVEKNSYDAGFRALGKLLEEKNVDRVTAAYISWVYSECDPAAKKNSVFIKGLDELLADSLNPYATSLLGLTYNNISNKKTAATVLQRLMKTGQEDQNFISWGRDKYYTWQYDKVQTTAFALKLMIAVEPTSPAIIKAVRTLIREQKGKSWHSTQQTATVIFALTDYLKLTNELEPDFTTEIFINGKQLRKVTFEKDKLAPEDANIKLNYASFPLVHGKNTIRVVKKGKGTLYAGADVELYYPDISFTKEQNFTITKEVSKLVETRAGNSIIYKKSNPDKVKSGDILLVKIKVKTNRSDDQYMMVEDMLPAGFEVVKDDNLYNIEGESSYTGYWPGYWNWFYADKEIRDSKITYFVTYAPQDMEFTYLIRAQAPGYYSSAPVYAGLMYYPEIRGYGPRTLFKVLPN
ncbi:hypothetical protein MASR1M107_00230 [Ignavibacteriales bacterium]